MNSRVSIITLPSIAADCIPPAATPRRMLLIRLHHRFVLAGIERLVEGADFLDAESIENLCQNAISGGHALDQSVCLSSVPLGGAEGTAQIVDNLQQLAGEVRDRVLLGVLRPPFALSPGI